MEISNTSKIGVSAAASWAWGTSLVMGMEIAQVRGVSAFLIWAVANCLALGLFGLLTRTGLLQERIYKLRAVKLFALIIQGFCLIIQLNIINKILSGFIENGLVSYLVTSVIGMVFVLAMFKKGLQTSIATDLIQWAFALVSIFLILLVGIYSGAERVVFPQSSTSDIYWGLWSACILFSGVMGDVQHWQRAEQNPKGYYLATLLFAVYLALVLCMAYFEFNRVMSIILLIATLGITTSTIDSIAVAFHTAHNKRIGTGIAIFLCLVWGLFIDWGIMSIWSRFGVYRVAFAVLLLVLSYIYRERINKILGFYGGKK